jgi:two-component system, sensor histidine kinase and response regulator
MKLWGGYMVNDYCELLDRIGQDNISKPNILLVEDFEINSTLFIKYLEKGGLSCDVAVNGEQAVKACSEKDYDIIFMDCQMPYMDGYEATKRIRAFEGEKKHANIIAMTASAMRGDKERCLEAGMDDYISKPFKFEELLSMIHKYERDIKNEDNKRVGTDYFSEVVAALMKESGLDKETCIELMDSFCEQAQKLIYRIKEDVNENNLEEARTLLHQLKGSAGSMRAKQIAKLALDAEGELKASNIEKLISILEEIKNKVYDLVKKRNLNIEKPGN